jgi:hypothetical protein
LKRQRSRSQSSLSRLAQTSPFGSKPVCPDRIQHKARSSEPRWPCFVFLRHFVFFRLVLCFSYQSSFVPLSRGYLVGALYMFVFVSDQLGKRLFGTSALCGTRSWARKRAECSSELFIV